MATKCLNFNFEEVQILARESIERPVRIIEAIRTKLMEETVNKTFVLPACYYRILERYASPLINTVFFYCIVKRSLMFIRVFCSYLNRFHSQSYNLKLKFFNTK